MKLHRQYIKGLTVFKEPVEIDFTQLPEGLIAITGANGQGKTSLLESMFASLYRSLPSRDGALYDWCAGRDAQLGLTLAFNGHQYNIRLLIDATAGKAEAFLFEDGRPLVNGKVTAFDREIARIFGPSDFLLSSVFSAQKKTGSFSRIPVAERKALFIDLLGLGHYPELEQKAKREMERESLDLERLRGERQSLEAQVRALEDIERQIYGTRQLQSDSLATLTLKECAVSELRRRLSQLAGRIGETREIDTQTVKASEDLQNALAAIRDSNAKIQNRQAAILQDVDRKREDAAAALARAEGNLAAIRLKARARGETVRNEKSELASRILVLESIIADWQDRRRNNEILLAQREPIAAAAARKTALESRREEISAELMTSVEADRRISQARTALAEARGNYQLIEQQIQAGSVVVAELGTIPCQGQPPYTACPKILSAVQVREQMPALVAESQRKAAAIATLERAATTNGHRSAADIQAELRDCEGQIQAADREARLMASVDQAEARIQDLDSMIAGAEKEKADLQVRADLSVSDPLLSELGCQETEAVEVLEDARRGAEIAREEQRRTQTALTTSKWPDPLLEELMAQLVTADEQRRSIVALLASLNARAAERQQFLDEQAAAEHQLSMAAGEERRAQEECARLAAEIQTLEARKKELEVIGTAIAELEQKIQERQVEVSDWALLIKALSKDGIPALEIDAAGPGISAIVNDLLSHCFSSRFAIDMQTQRASADGKKMIEDFDIRVLDNRRGAWGSIGGLSGGEEVVVNEAIGFGIAIYNKSERRFETAFRDETTGSLDPAAAVAYVDMLRRARVLGQFHQVLFITHNPECAELADARIHCDAGKVTIQ